MRVSGVSTAADGRPAVAEANQEFDRKGTITVAGAHFSHDLYSAFLGPLIPAVQEKLGVPLFVASLMVPAQQVPSVFQPFIGAWADRTSKRWFVVLTPGIAAISVSMVGLAPHVALILLLLIASGLASAAFHAPSIALVGEYGGQQTGRAMSWFMAGGEAARSLGPLVITAAISWFTLEGSFVVVVFGVAASIILYFQIDTDASDQAAAARRAEGVDIRALLRLRIRWLVGLFGFALMVIFYTGPLNFLMVAYLLEQGHSEWFAGIALSIFFAAGGIGGLVGGSLSDRFGRRNVLLVNLICTAPVMYFFLLTSSHAWFGLLTVILAGIFAMANRPIQLALAQDILPESRAQMSGLMLAFGFVSMSLITLGLGAAGDIVGLESAMRVLPLFSILAIPFVFLLPRRGDPLPMLGDA
ncbi:MAG: MFS transporter [Chloroflexota bacterium]